LNEHTPSRFRGAVEWVAKSQRRRTTAVRSNAQSPCARVLHNTVVPFVPDAEPRSRRPIRVPYRSQSALCYMSMICAPVF